MLNKIQSEREDTMVAQERMKTQQHYYTINWAHRSVDKHTAPKIDTQFTQQLKNETVQNGLQLWMLSLIKK